MTANIYQFAFLEMVIYAFVESKLCIICLNVVENDIHCTGNFHLNYKLY